MHLIGYTEKVWLTLIVLTLAGALLGETGESGWLLTATVVFLIAVKGGIVIDHYMEMRFANQRMRNILRLFIILIPLLVILSHGWGDGIKTITTIR